MGITIYNYNSGEVAKCHLPLLIGDVDNFSQREEEITVWNDSVSGSKKIKWPVIEGCFKALVRLRRGPNKIKLKFGHHETTITLLFENHKAANFVRPVYIVCADDNGRFQGPDSEDCSPDSARKRIVLGAQLIQCFTSEKMREHGFDRNTFHIEVDSLGNPVCPLFKSKLKLADAYKMSGNDLWSYFGRELMTSPRFTHKDRCKWYCFMSFTRYKPPEGTLPKTHSEILKYTKGHTALGGGGLALFGTGNLHTWAESLEEVVHRFTDEQKINRKVLMDDSAYREYHWANYATGLGASLHELGHTFDLAHTPTGIMARGFDDLHKVFIVQRSKVTCADSRESIRSTASYSRDSLPRTLSDGDFDLGLGNMTLESHARRYRDVCYDSPVKKSKGYMTPPPLVVKVETEFRPMIRTASMTISVKNYDGTETRRTIVNNQDEDSGAEALAEFSLMSEQITQRILSRRRRTSSCSSVSSTGSTSSLSPTTSHPSTLPNSPDISRESDLSMPDIKFADDGAHWYRSSAVLLKYHKWFNNTAHSDPRKQPELLGGKVKSRAGLRLIELRSDPQGMVFHHWEFIVHPPIEFTLKLSRIKNLPESAVIITCLASDTYGNIIKRKIKVADLPS